jgi:hypothetical protein
MVGMVVIIFPCLESRQWEHPCLCSFKTPSNRCIDLQEEPKISSATSLQRRKKPIKNPRIRTCTAVEGEAAAKLVLCEEQHSTIGVEAEEVAAVLGAPPLAL